MTTNHHRPGYATTNILEELLHEYITTHTQERHFKGEYHWLAAYAAIVAYNRTETTHDKARKATKLED